MAKRITHSTALFRLRKLQGQRSIREFAAALKLSPMLISQIYRGKRGLGKAVLKHLKLAKNPASEPTYTEVK